MAVEEQLLYGPELPENFLDYYKIPAGPYDPMAEWRLREEAENERSFAQLKAGTALSNIRDPGASIRREAPPQSGGLADFRLGNQNIGLSNLNQDSVDKFGNPVNVRDSQLDVSARLDDFIMSNPEVYADFKAMIGRSGVDVSSKEGAKFIEEFKRRWAVELGLGNKNVGGSIGWSDDTDTERIKAELHKTFGNAEVSANFQRDIRDSYPQARGRGGSETRGGVQLTYPFKKGGMIRNPYPYEPKTI